MGEGDDVGKQATRGVVSKKDALQDAVIQIALRWAMRRVLETHDRSPNKDYSEEDKMWEERKRVALKKAEAQWRKVK